MKYDLINSVRCELPKKFPCNKMNKEIAIPPIKPNIPIKNINVLFKNENKK